MAKESYHHGDLKKALIDAGIDILKQEGLHGLSLRSAALKAGVSHSAPYAHFEDKQALIAAISTKGLTQLFDKLSRIAHQYEEHPLAQLYEVAWAYAEFALQQTGLFKVIFSSAIEREHDYPDFVEISHRNFNLIVEVVKNNQKSGILHQRDPHLLAVSIWSMVHGFISLFLEKQIPSHILTKYEIEGLIKEVLDQMMTRFESD